MASQRIPLVFGPANAGLAPSLAIFQNADTFAPLPAPAIYENPAGNGAYYFDIAWDSLNGVSTVFFVTTALNGVQLDGTLTAPASAAIPSGTGGATAGSGAKTLADLRLAVRQRSDTENDPHVQDSELTDYINQSAFELYDKLVAAYGDDYFVTTPDYAFTSDGQRDVYPFPDGSSTYKLQDGTVAPAVYKPIGVDVSTAQGQPGTWVTLQPFNIGERNTFAVAGQVPYLGILDVRFRLRGNNVWFTPLPAGNQTFRLLYVPRMSLLVGDTDVLDGVSGWTEYVILDAAKKVLEKQETDASHLERDLARMGARIESMKQHRLTGHAKTTQRTRRNQFGYDSPWQGGRGPWGA